MTDNNQTHDAALPPDDDTQLAAFLLLFNTLNRVAAAINGVACLQLPAGHAHYSIDYDERQQLIDARAAVTAVTLGHGHLGAAAPLMELLTALVDVSCHAVANLHPETVRDVPAAALMKAATWIGKFYPDPQRANELASVWMQRARLVEEFAERRDRDPSFCHPAPPETPFPTAIAGGYLQGRQGNAGVFDGQYEIGTNREGQPVVMQRATDADRKLQQVLAALGADTDGLPARKLTAGRRTKAAPAKRAAKTSKPPKRTRGRGGRTVR